MNDNNSNNDNSNNNNSNDASRRGSLYTVDHTDGIPKDDEGRVHHLSVKRGDVANRIVSVGDSTRARSLVNLLEKDSVVEIPSHRPGAFCTYTGMFESRNGVQQRVSIIATGMGGPNMDFVVREARAVVDGPLAMIRFGSCGILDPHTPVGRICVATESVQVTRNPDAFRRNTTTEQKKYHISQPVVAHPGLSQQLFTTLSACLENTDTTENDKNDNTPIIIRGANCSADSFYSSQGRPSCHFDDDNATLLQELTTVTTMTTTNAAVTCEMETFHLLDLADCACHPQHKMAAAAAVICVANRHDHSILETRRIRELERDGGRAVLQAICDFDLESI